MKKIIIILLLLGFIVYVFGEDLFEAEGSDGDFEFSLDGQACYDYVSKKGWTEGDNTSRGGSEFYVGVGVDSSGIDVNTMFYIDGIQNAFIRSQMNAKTSIAAFQAKKMESEISNEFIQAAKDGTKPVNVIQGKDVEAETFDDLSMYQKMKVLIHQKLDESVSQENKDKVGEGERVLQKEIDGILSQNVFQDSVSATASSNIRGMKAVYSNLSAKPSSSKTTVCNVVVWSENFVKYADAMATGNLKVLSNPKKKRKPLIEQVKKGDSLMVTFGTFMDRDENGDMAILSYAQSGLKTNSSNSQKAAISAAKLKAERAIIQFRSENVEIAEKTENFEVTTEKSDGMIDTYSEENIDRRQKASASGVLQGARVVYRDIKKHPVSGKGVAIIVVGWSPSSASLARSMKETLEKPPVGERTGSSIKQPVDAEDLEEGSSSGDDEDDF